MSKTSQKWLTVAIFQKWQAVWHYGLKLQWYLIGDRDWRYGMVWYGFVGIVLYGGRGGIRWLVSSCMKRFQSWTIIDYHELSWGGVMTGMDDWHGWIAWMTGMDDWHGCLAYMIGIYDWHGWLAWTTGMDDWHGRLAWMTGWMTGMEDWQVFIERLDYNDQLVS